MVVYCDRLPHPGETVLGGQFHMFGGGKGANQAVAADRAGGAITFLGAYGPDTFGTDARNRLAKEGINVDHFQCVQNAPSGVALILVDGVTRDNLIAVAKSANEAVDSAMVSAARPVFESAAAVISQLEIRDGAIEAVARLCHELGKPFVLNPAPSRTLPKRIYESLHVIVVNEHEARDITGQEDIRNAIRQLHDLGCKNVVVTLGAERRHVFRGTNRRVCCGTESSGRRYDGRRRLFCWMAWSGRCRRFFFACRNRKSL